MGDLNWRLLATSAIVSIGAMQYGFHLVSIFAVIICFRVDFIGTFNVVGEQSA
jgi:hypothetical protein